MADNIQTDSDSQGPIQPGVGRSDQTNKPLHQINPNWVEDGYGVVGPQRQVIPQSPVTPHPVKFGIDNSIPNLTATGLIVTDGTTTITNVNKISFDGSVFTVVDYGNGEAHIQCAS
jgi:hypothetical protein